MFNVCDKCSSVIPENDRFTEECVIIDGEPMFYLETGEPVYIKICSTCYYKGPAPY